MNSPCSGGREFDNVLGIFVMIDRNYNELDGFL
jgi:hypothetical protein